MFKHAYSTVVHTPLHEPHLHLQTYTFLPRGDETVCYLLLLKLTEFLSVSSVSFLLSPIHTSIRLTRLENLHLSPASLFNLTLTE